MKGSSQSYPFLLFSMLLDNTAVNNQQKHKMPQKAKPAKKAAGAAKKKTPANKKPQTKKTSVTKAKAGDGKKPAAAKKPAKKAQSNENAKEPKTTSSLPIGQGKPV